MGFNSVKTYIQSGNVLFQSEKKDQEKLESQIEKVLSMKFNYAARVVVRSEEEIENTVLHFPEIFKNALWKHNVMFLCKEIDSKEILTRFEIKKDIEQYSYYNGVIFWSAQIDMSSKSTMEKLSSRKEYQFMTVRNFNTTSKIFELMKK
jgi:uncharacterized protein (DUF1697 family)